MKEIADNSSQTITVFREDLCGFADSAQHSAAQLVLVQDRCFSSLMEMEHILYKQNAYRIMKTGPGSHEWKMVDVDHHSCRLGQSIDSHDKYQGLRAFDELKQPHETFHLKAMEILAYLQQDWCDDKALRISIYEAFQEIEAISSDFMQRMNQVAHLHDK